jgi:phage-related baseplate assembly protein
MANSFTSINLSAIAAPAVVEQIDYETILAEMLADLRARDPAYTALVESDPAYKVLEVAAYRETLIRQRANESAIAVMLPYAKGTDLDNLVANFNIERLLITPENPDTIPPTPAVLETDEDLLRRALLAWEGITTAGSTGSYIFHSLSADADVKDASAISPVPGQVLVTVLSRSSNGTPEQPVLDAVEAALSAEMVRPLTDQVVVQAATIEEYTIEATLILYQGPDSEVVVQASRDAAQKYADENHRLGNDITLSGLYAALHQPGVQKVNLINPTEPLVKNDTEAAYCTNIVVNFGGRDV